MFSLATRYYLEPVRTITSECGMPAACISMGVPVALGEVMSSVFARRCCGLLRASSVQARTLARAAWYSISSAWTVILSYNQEVIVDLARSSGMSFRVGQSPEEYYKN